MTVTRYPPPLRTRRRPLRFLLITVACVIGAIGVDLVAPSVSRLFGGPRFVDRLTVVNPTAYDVAIDTRSNEGEGWMAVGTAHRQRTTSFEEVVDQGPVWVFRFRAQGEESRGLEITRAELVASGWRFDIPMSVADDFLAKGSAPPP